MEESPSIDTHKPLSRQFEEVYYNYYGYPSYWEGSYIWGANPYIISNFERGKNSPQEKSEWDPFLRSTHAVTGNSIHASDGEIGHVNDFIIDDETWAIRYLVLDTSNWWAGKKVLISPHWVENVSWSESTVTINLLRETIKHSPEYSEELLLTRDFETQLHKHYNRKVYWYEEPLIEYHHR
ncbi:MAG: PRC-barrel domain-containing protein [Bacteroidota bacterium]